MIDRATSAATLPIHDSRQIANWIIRRAEADGRPISIMHVLKLAYRAHGWILVAYDHPPVNETVEAWEHGPAISTIFYTFRPYGIYNTEPVPVREQYRDRNRKTA